MAETPRAFEVGVSLSSEEQGPAALVRVAHRAEELGFGFAMISDHFHPWIDQQGQSPFVWSVLGAIAQATERLRIGTAVTCPLIRIHPVVLAQAAATTSVLMEGRFLFGVGTGENLNEHVVGARWPPIDVRLEMLEEAVALIRHLWQGGLRSWRGRHYTVEDARVYTLPEPVPPILVAAGGRKSAELAGRIGDGLIAVEPDQELAQTFSGAGGGRKPRYGQVAACWAPDRDRALETAHRWWPLAGVPGPLRSELRLPSQFEAACRLVRPEEVARNIVLGPDPEPHAKALQEFQGAGYEHVFVHQVGPDQEGFLEFYAKEVLPAVNATQRKPG